MAGLNETVDLLRQAKDTSRAVAQNVWDWEGELLHDFFSPAVAEGLGAVLSPIRAAVALLAGALAYMAMLAGPPLLGLLMWGLTTLAVPVASAVIKIIGDARKQLDPEVAQLGSEVLSEMMGIEVAPEDIPTGKDFASHVERVRKLGGLLHDTLIREFAADGTLSPEQGVAAARAFSGFVVNFGVASAFISILGETLSLGQLEEFRELGSETARGLGLGRLHRMALRPLIEILVGTPLEWSLNKQYRPKMFGSGAAIKAFFRGELTDEQLHEELAREGWSDDKLNALIDLARPGLSEADLLRLHRWGTLELEETVERFKAKGWTDQDARLNIRSDQMAAADGRVREFVNQIEKLTLDGFLTFQQFRQMVDNLPLWDDEKKWEHTIIGNLLETPHKQLTLAQMETGFIEGVVDLAEWQQFLRVEGYSHDDALILTFELLLKARKKAEADQLKAERATARGAAPSTS